MFRFMFGLAMGWLGATWYYSNQQTLGNTGMAGRSGQDEFEHRAHGVLHETIQAASELTQEAKAATTMGKSSLQGKAERIRRAAEE